MDSAELQQSRRRALGRLGALVGALSSPLAGGATPGDEPSVDDSNPWGRARAQLVLNSRLAYFDTAQLGPMLRSVLANEYRTQEALQTDPFSFYRDRYSNAAVQELCRRLSTWLDCSVDELCFSRSAARGLMQCSQALSLQAGDEVLINGQLSLELRRFWTQEARQRGLVLKTIALPMPLHGVDEVMSAFENAIDERSKVLVCSHIQQTDGAVLPIRELCQLAKSRGLISMVDGSLSMGALQLSMRDLGCDIYSASLCHWLNGPQNTGVLYVRAGMQSMLQDDGLSGTELTLAGNRFGWPQLQQRWPTDFIELAPQFQSLSTALSWQESIGRSRIEARLRELQTYTRLRLQNLDGIEPITPLPPGLWLQLLSLRTPKHSAIELAEWLRNNDKVVVSAVAVDSEGVNGLRVSLHIYNSFDDIERLALGLQRALRV